ncbi:MAG: hypothetical protein ABL997_04590 [Planctomycetota bacterium]
MGSFRTSRWIRSVSIAVLVLPVLRAQQSMPAAAAAFVPAQTRVELFVDLTACRECDLIDDLKSSLFGGMLKRLEERSGLDIDALERIAAYLESPTATTGDGGQQRRVARPAGLAVLAGSQELVLPKATDELRASEIAGREARVLRGGHGDPDLLVQVAPGLLVFAAQSVLQPRLAGTATAGTVPSELRDLAEESGTLVRIAGFVDRAQIAAMLPPPFLPSMLPERGSLRLCATTVDGASLLALELSCRRFEHEASSTQLSAAIDALIERLGESPPTKPLRDLLARLERKVEADAVFLRLPIGTTRDLLAAIQTLLPMFGAPPPAPPAAPSSGR